MPASVTGEPIGREPPPSVIHLVAQAAREAGSNAAVTAGDRTWSYRQYAGLVAGLGGRLSGRPPPAPCRAG